MAKWKSGARGGQDRGSGAFRGGRGRGNNNNTGRGGALWAGRGRGRGHAHSSSAGSFQDELDQDFTLPPYANAPVPANSVLPPVRGRGIPAYRGRGRAVPFIPNQFETNFPGRGRGFDIPRRQVQGIGVRKDARRPPMLVGGKQPLSGLLYQDRPLLRPIVFMPSTETLFEDEEELLQPIVEGVDDALKSPIPTADRVTRVFSGGNIPSNIRDKDEDGAEDEEDEIEVIDFNDFGKQLDPTPTTTETNISKREAKLALMENTTGRRQETQLLPLEVEHLTEMVDKTLSPANCTGVSVAAQTSVNGNHLFYVDTQPSSVPNGLDISYNQEYMALLLDDDDVIVYEAPNPRTTSRMSLREKETTELVAEISTINGHADVPVTTTDFCEFSSYDRSTAPSTSVSNEPPASSSVAVSFPKSLSTESGAAEDAETTATFTALSVPPTRTPRQGNFWKSKVHRANSKKQGIPRKTSFGALAAVREEVLLCKLDGEREERFEERRRGDSDLDWGDSDDGENTGENVTVENTGEERELDADMERVLGMLQRGKGKELEKQEIGKKQADDDLRNDDHGMEVDVEIDVATMQQFVNGLSGPNAGRHVTMHDIECEEAIRKEDEGDADAEQRGSSGDEDDEDSESLDEEGEEAAIIEEAKFMRVGNLGDVDSEDTDDLLDASDEDDEDLDDDDDYEENSFQARLNRLRALSIEQNVEAGSDDDSDDEDLLERNMTLAEKDEHFIQHLNAILVEKDDIFTAKDRKQRRKFFTSFTSVGGNADDLDWSSSPARRRHRSVSPEVLQFELDRQKKAELKKEREQERLKRGPDPRKNGLKGRKAMLAAAAVDSTITVLPNRVDMTTLVQQIRRFIADVEGRPSMSVPPTDKETRKNIHEIATAFNLKSKSKGKGDARYTTLIRTTKSGIRVDDAKIARIVRRSVDDSLMLEQKSKGMTRVPRHREGDVVGKAAPKLDNSNVGFKLLEMMGWSEGDRIGASTNGLEAPLRAIIKTSKLGLGAKKE